MPPAVSGNCYILADVLRFVKGNFKKISPFVEVNNKYVPISVYLPVDFDCMPDYDNNRIKRRGLTWFVMAFTKTKC